MVLKVGGSSPPYAPIVQLVRTTGFTPVGCGFDSRLVHNFPVTEATAIGLAAADADAPAGRGVRADLNRGLACAIQSGWHHVAAALDGAMRKADSAAIKTSGAPRKLQNGYEQWKASFPEPIQCTRRKTEESIAAQALPRVRECGGFDGNRRQATKFLSKSKSRSKITEHHRIFRYIATQRRLRAAANS